MTFKISSIAHTWRHRIVQRSNTIRPKEP